MDDLNDKLKTGIGEVNVDFLESNMQSHENWKAPRSEGLGGGNRKEGPEQVKSPVMVSVDESHIGNQYGVCSGYACFFPKSIYVYK